MAIEQSWNKVAPRLFTSDGTQYGEVTTSSTSGIKVKQRVIIQAPTLPSLELQVKRVVSSTQFIVGPLPDDSPKQGRSNLNTKTDISAYTVALGSFFYAVEQPKSRLKIEDIEQSTYEQEPTVAKRVIPVDEFGDFYTTENPVPVEGQIEVTSDSPTQAIIQNVSLTLANTEYEITLPNNIKRFELKIRNHDSKARIAFSSGETASNYWTIDRGNTFESKDLYSLIGNKIYIQTDKNNQVLEVIAWVKN